MNLEAGKRFVVFCSVAIAITVGTVGARLLRKPKPNIVVILIDDVGYNDVGWHNPNMKTPYLDNLAKTGVILENNYMTPLCTPSRAALMTGRYPFHLGLQRGVLGNQEPYGIPLEFKLLPQKLREVGYRNHAFGKWHLGYCDWKYTPTNRGFHTFFGFYNGAENNYLHCVSRNYIFTADNCTGLDFRINKDIAFGFTNRFSTDLYAKRAVQLIQQHNKRQPMFMYLALANTHWPVQSKEEYMARCQGMENDARKLFCASMAAIDDAVKNVTEALKEKGMYDNTIIILSSDNGGAFNFGANNAPLRGEKNTLWDGGSRVPGFVHSPLLKQTGYTSHELMHVTDWYPTLTKLAGATAERGLDGVDQWDLISNNAPSNRKEFVYTMDDYTNRNGTVVGAIRVGNYKLINGSAGVYNEVVPESKTVDNSFNGEFIIQYTSLNNLLYNFSDTAPKLFDLQNDESESVNLADSMPDKVKELQERFKFYFTKMLPAYKQADDPAGAPEKFNGVYSPGWCTARVTVPTAQMLFSSQNNIFG